MMVFKMVNKILRLRIKRRVHKVPIYGGTRKGRRCGRVFFVTAVGILKSNAQCVKQRYHWTRYAKIVA